MELLALSLNRIGAAEAAEECWWCGAAEQSVIHTFVRKVLEMARRTTSVK